MSEKIYRTNDELWGKIRQEAILGIAVNKILGRLTGEPPFTK
jgi:hypothetical protein